MGVVCAPATGLILDRRKHDPHGLSHRGFAALLTAFGAPAGGGAREADEAPCEILLTSDVKVAMHYGVRLATDVYRPARGGRP